MDEITNNEYGIDESFLSKYLTFSVGDEVYGIETQHIDDIQKIMPVTDLPGMPHYIKGVINLRSKIVPVIDIRLRFGKESVEYNDRTCIIVVDIDSMQVGIIVDTVVGVPNISEDDIMPPPRDLNHNDYVKGIGKLSVGVVLLLDCFKLINDL